MSRTPTNFGAVRLLAAGAVVLGHSFVLAGATPPSLLGTPIHVLAVRVFFVVSGYLVAASWLRDPNPARFLLRRALRIMPGLVAVTLLTAGVLGPLATRLPVSAYLRDPATTDYLWNALLAPRFALPGVFADDRPFTAVNGSLWSLPVEAMMYLLLPLYAGTALLRRLALPAVAVASIAAALAFTVIWPNQVQPVVYDTSIPFGLRFAADFMLGVLVMAWRLERWLNLQTALLLVAAAAMASGTPLLQALLGSVALPYAVLSFCLTARPVLGRFDRGADLSYGIYLWGGPLQQVAFSVVGATASPLGLTLAAAGPILAAAALSWFLVERPAMRLKPGAAPHVDRRSPPWPHPPHAQ